MPKPEPVLPATIVLELRDPKADVQPLEGLARQLELEGLILGAPAPVEFRRSIEDPRRIEIPCTLPGVLESRRWLRSAEVRKHYGAALRQLLRRPPRVLAMRTPHDAETLTCRCRRPKDLCLRWNWFLPQSPLECGACRGALPAWRVNCPEV